MFCILPLDEIASLLLFNLYEILKKSKAMNRSRKKSRIKKIILAVIALATVFLYSYHLFYKPPQVRGGIARLNKVLSGHHDGVWTVQFSPDGNHIASASIDGTVKIWRMKDGMVSHQLVHPIGVTGFEYSQDGKFIVTSSYDSKVRLWRVADDSLLKVFSGHTGTVWTVAISPDGQTIASGAEDKTVRLWDVTSGTTLKILKGHNLNIWSVKFSPDGNTLASASFDKTVKLWDAHQGKLLFNLEGHQQAVVALGFSPTGDTLASTSDDLNIRFWNPKNGKTISVLRYGPEHPQGVAFSPDGKRLIASGRDKTMLGELLQNFMGDSKFNTGISMRLFDLPSGKLIQTFSHHANDVNDVAFSKDGNFIAAASSDNTVSIWEIQR